MDVNNPILNAIRDPLQLPQPHALHCCARAVNCQAGLLARPELDKGRSGGSWVPDLAPPAALPSREGQLPISAEAAAAGAVSAA